MRTNEELMQAYEQFLSSYDKIRKQKKQRSQSLL